MTVPPTRIQPVLVGTFPAEDTTPTRKPGAGSFADVLAKQLEGAKPTPEAAAELRTPADAPMAKGLAPTPSRIFATEVVAPAAPATAPSTTAPSTTAPSTTTPSTTAPVAMGASTLPAAIVPAAVPTPAPMRAASTELASPDASQTATAARAPAPGSTPRGTEAPTRVDASSGASAASRGVGAEGVPEGYDPLTEALEARIDARDRHIFELASAANHRVESNERAVVSTLRTTAQTHASYGLGQLTVQAHISQAQRLDDRALSSLGLSRGELDAMRGRGEAAGAWFRGLVRGAHHPRAIEASGLDRASMVDARMLVQAGDLDTLVHRYGDRFSATTGIPAEELRALAQTEVLARTELREAFRAQFAVDHGAEFDPSRRDGAQIVHTVDNLTLTHPELEDVLSRLGEGQGSLAAVGHYLGVGDVAENLHGWYARGAQSVVGAPRLDGFLERLDPLSSGLRNLQNVERALAAVSGVRGLEGADRARVVTRLARCFHGAPSSTRQAFFDNGDLSRPRFHDVSRLEAALDQYVERRPWSDARVLRAFESLAAERGLA